MEDTKIKLINELYSKYLNLSKVAKELKISASTVKKYLNEDNLKKAKKKYEDRDALFYYIYRLFGEYDEIHKINPLNIIHMERMMKQGINYKAQLLTLKWYYEIKKNPIKEEYKTIGIIPYIINNAAYYYKTKEAERLRIEKEIEKQLQQDKITLKFNPSDYMGRKKKKRMIDLNEIGDE